MKQMLKVAPKNDLGYTSETIAVLSSNPSYSTRLDKALS